MKKILKISEVRQIASACGLDAEILASGAEWLNRGDAADDAFSKAECNAVVLYCLTREVNNMGRGGEANGARLIFAHVDQLLGLRFGTAHSIAIDETLRAGRWLLVELNMDLDHITLTNANPFAKQTMAVAI